MPYIPETVIDEILTKVDIIEFIGRYLPLKRAGSNYKGLCPFHADKDPSFSVSREKGLWKCFGCGLGGNIITFVEQKENLDFPDAVRYIADIFQIPIPTVKGEKAGRTRLLYSINRQAEEFFTKVLKSKHGRPFREYLKEREYDREIIEAFNIGASLPAEIRNGLTRELTGQGFPKEDITALGLAKDGSYGLYDAFRGRLMFPIRDVLTRTVGFGARLREGTGPKYLNSPESHIFKKGEVLFGIDKAKSGIRQEGFILLMEGYTDVMRCHQCGLTNAVASMGTALTDKQAHMLKRYSDDIILCFDADDAGQKAAERSLSVLLSLEMKPRVLLIPQGEDPDSILRSQGIDEFRKILDEAVHFIDFILQRATGGETPTAVEKKIEAFRATIPTLEAVPNTPLQADYLERIARSLEVNADILRDVIKAHRHGIKETTQIAGIKMRIEGESKLEREFIAGLIKHPRIMPEARSEIASADFNDPLHAEVYSIISNPSFPLADKGLTLRQEIHANPKVYSFVVDRAFSDTEREITEKHMHALLYKMIERKLIAENRTIEQRLQTGDEVNADLQVKIISNLEKLKKMKSKLLG